MAKARKKKAVKKPRKAAKKAVKKKVKKLKKVRCAGKTKDGKRCKRMVTPPDKFCYLHKKKRR